VLAVREELYDVKSSIQQISDEGLQAIGKFKEELSQEDEITRQRI
jgi:hypothetical protein